MKTVNKTLKIYTHFDDGETSHPEADHVHQNLEVPVGVEPEIARNFLAAQSPHLTAMYHMAWACRELVDLMSRDAEAAEALVSVFSEITGSADFREVCVERLGPYSPDRDLPRIAKMHFGYNMNGRNDDE